MSCFILLFDAGFLLLAGGFPSGEVHAIGALDWAAITLVLGGSYRDAPSSALVWCGLDRMRARTGPRERQGWLGFRVVRDVPPVPE